MDEKIKEYVYSHKEEILSGLGELVAVPSVLGEPEDGAPFGAEPKRALLKMREICQGMGFGTAVIGDAVLCADYGDEPELGILAHLDVVPAQGEDWTTDPFAMTEKDGVLYGRGVIDDKGPAVAALWALNAVKSLGIPLRKGVRLIFGTNEENGSEDLSLYKQRAEFPPKVFTPDGSFPVINIEKGMLRLSFSGAFGGNFAVEFRGGNIPNAVPDKAKAILRKATGSKVQAAIGTSDDENAPKFTVSERGSGVFISCSGRPAHASTPETGVNAVTAMLSVVSRLMDEEMLGGLSRLFPPGETDGASVGLKRSDIESGALTCVLTTLTILPAGDIEGTVDVRFPTCMKLDEVKDKLVTALNGVGIKECTVLIGDEPHIVSENSEFVRQLLSVYERVEGGRGQCIAIGGGTYVHNIDGGVAFGAERGDTDYHMHGADEFITVEELLNDAVLFAHAIVEVCG